MPPATDLHRTLPRNAAQMARRYCTRDLFDDDPWLDHDDTSEAYSIGGKGTRVVEAYEVSLRRPIDEVDNEDRSTFDKIVDQWWPVALLSSSIHAVILTPAYQEMIGMGPRALPLVLTALKDRGGPHWFWALRAIARDDVGSGLVTVSEAREAWVRWGIEHGYLD